VLEDQAFRALHARYSARVPDAPRYFAAHRFGYWQIEPLRVRAIGGFGAIHWLDGDAILRDPLGGGLAEARSRIVDHMNDDHEVALLDMCAAASGLRTTRGRKIVALDRAGCLVRRAPRSALPGLRPGDPRRRARAVFVELTRAARALMRHHRRASGGDSAEVSSITSGERSRARTHGG
jgi:hypothetical protein